MIRPNFFFFLVLEGVADAVSLSSVDVEWRGRRVRIWSDGGSLMSSITRIEELTRDGTNADEYVMDMAAAKATAAGYSLMVLSCWFGCWVRGVGIWDLWSL